MKIRSGRPRKEFLFRSRRLNISVSNQVYYTLKKYDVSISFLFEQFALDYFFRNEMKLVTEEDIKDLEN